MLSGRAHALAFAQNGFGDKQSMVRKSLLVHLGTDAMAPALRGLPTLAELQAYLGVRAEVPLGALFSGIYHRPARPGVIDLTQEDAAAESDAETEPQLWSSRLRPRRSGSACTLAQPSSPPPDSGAAPSAAPPLPPPAWPPMELPARPPPGPELRRRLQARLTERRP